MYQGLRETVDYIGISISYFIPELLLAAGIAVLIVAGLFRRFSFHSPLALSFAVASLLMLPWSAAPFAFSLFDGMVRSDNFSAFLRGLIDVATALTVLLTWRQQRNQPKLSEYYALLLSVALGAHLLVMSMNMLMIFLSLELISIASYLLAGFSFTRSGAEGGLKYFLFGSVASAIMLYGITLLYGITGTLEFFTSGFAEGLAVNESPLLLVASLMTLGGFLYKMAAAPLHPWAPDVYEAAPMPVVAFFSVVPKLAGVGILVKFVDALKQAAGTSYDWQSLLSVVAIVTLTVGNFAALWQKNVKRLMAYSAIAHSGFLLVGVVAFVPHGTQYMLYYASVYTATNFLVFAYLQYYDFHGFTTIASYAGAGKRHGWPMVLLLAGFVSLMGLPPTGGFTAKLFIFSSLWESYQGSGKPLLLWLMVFGLLNTVVSLFYYLRIPYFAFIKNGDMPRATNNLVFENLLGLLLVLVVLCLFFSPGLLMGWINKITFVH